MFNVLKLHDKLLFSFQIRIQCIRITHCRCFQIDYILIRFKIIIKWQDVPPVPISPIVAIWEKWCIVAQDDNFQPNQKGIELKASTIVNSNAQNTYL